MKATRYIGRVGALAAALGVGVALSTGAGVAWAEGDATDVGSKDRGGNDGGQDASSRRVQTGPLSAQVDRIRKQVDAGLDARADAVNRVQSTLEKSRTRLDDGRAELRAKLEESTRSAAIPRVPLAGLRPAAGKAAGDQIVPEAVDAVPDLRLPERPGAVIVKVAEAAKDVAQHAADAIASARDALPLPSALSLDAGPLAGLRQTAAKAEGRQIVPEGGVPDLRLPQRPGAALVKAAEATKDVAQRAADAIASARDALPPPSALSLHAVQFPAVGKTVEAPQFEPTVLVSTLLAAAGLSPLAGDGPPTPGPSAFALAVVAWLRRESERTMNPFGTNLASTDKQVSALAEGESAALAAVAAVWQANPGLTPAPVITGDASIPPQTVEPGSLNPAIWTTGPFTNTDHWFIAGTDLGIMWDSGYTDPQTGKPVIYTLFGDTYSAPGMSGDWRNNVLLRSSDTDLSNGLQFSDALIHAGAQFPGDPNGIPTWYGTDGPEAGAAQVIDDPGFNGLFGSTHTIIPTAAIAVENEDGSVTQYATVMSVRTWDNPGSWTTNYSAIAYSTDEGKTWTVDPDTVRSSGWLRASTRYVPGDERFQQNALVYGNPDDPNSYTGPDPSSERYIYVYGTPSGRQGSAYLARVPESQLTDLDAYQYWAGENPDGTGNWVTGDPSAAVRVLGASEDDLLPRLYDCLDLFTFGWFTKIVNGIWVGGLPDGGNISEMSVQYNQHVQRYLVTYTNGANSVVMRVSDSPQGTWSNATTLVPVGAGLNSGMYAPLIHPLSGTAALGEGNEKYLYFNLSQWGDHPLYNVRMMRADLDNLVIT